MYQILEQGHTYTTIGLAYELKPLPAIYATRDAANVALKDIITRRKAEIAAWDEDAENDAADILTADGKIFAIQTV